MSSKASRRGDDRVFVRDGRRHYRRKYSRTEPRIGAVLLVLLAALIGWVAWKGAHPDPELFAETEVLLAGGAQGVQPLEDRAAPGGAGGAGASKASADRGVLPEDLTASGWTEGPVSHFGYDNLYEKINGREDYYKSYGFERLTFVTLTREDSPSTLVDIELFDLGTPANALGAYSGERSPGVSPEIGSGGMAHFDRNALFMTRGRHYLRAIGSAESEEVRTELEHLKTAFEQELAGEDLPWAYAVFVGGLGHDPGQVSYESENAFSFSFATDVYSVLLEDGETELFVTEAGGADAARELAGRFTEGFLEYGTAVEGTSGPVWVKDRYISTLSGAAPFRAWVIGVRGAPDRAAAESALDDLQEAMAALAEGGPTGE